jgi:hypothetical protein
MPRLPPPSIPWCYRRVSQGDRHVWLEDIDATVQPRPPTEEGAPAASAVSGGPPGPPPPVSVRGQRLRHGHHGGRNPPRLGRAVHGGQRPPFAGQPGAAHRRRRPHTGPPVCAASVDEVWYRGRPLLVYYWPDVPDIRDLCSRLMASTFGAAVDRRAPLFLDLLCCAQAAGVHAAGLAAPNAPAAGSGGSSTPSRPPATRAQRRSSAAGWPRSWPPTPCPPCSSCWTTGSGTSSKRRSSWPWSARGAPRSWGRPPVPPRQLRP